MGTQDSWDKNNIYTLVGHYLKDNTFVDLNGELFDCITYRQYNRDIGNELCCVNLKWSESLNTWIIFQAVLIEEEDINVGN